MRKSYAWIPLFATACGGASLTTADVQAFRQLSGDISASVETYRGQAAAMTDAASCTAAEGQYDAAVRPMVERMGQLAGEMDAYMRDHGRGRDADMTCVTGAMRTELDRHRAAACASADMATDRAEAAGHAGLMDEFTAHQAARSNEMMGMMGGQMAGGGTAMPIAGCTP